MRKGGKASTEPLAPIVLRALETYVGNRTSGPIFLNADGTDRLSYSIAYKLIRRLAKRADIAGATRISPHSLRHSFATHHVRKGTKLSVVRDALGHSSLSTTSRYVELARELMDKEIQQNAL